MKFCTTKSFAFFSAMEDWKKMTLIVSVYMFLFEVRPLETYMTGYLTGPDGNVSMFEVAYTLESIKSYSALTGTGIMLVVSESLHKPVIIAFTLFSFIGYVLLMNSPNLTLMRVSMAASGATSNVYMLAYSFLCLRIPDKDQFHAVTSITSASMEFGIFVGSVMSQIIVSLSGGKYTTLPYYNATTIFLAMICACLLPTKRKRSYLTENILDENSRLLESGQTKALEPLKNQIVIIKPSKNNTVKVVLKKLFSDFSTSYSNTGVIKSSLWYIVTMAAHIQITSNMNVLYSYIVNRPGNHDVLSNGLAEALVTLCGATGAYLVGKVQFDWTRYGDAFTALCSIVMGAVMMSSYFYGHVIFVYSSYIIYALVSEMAFVLHVVEIAKRLESRCYSLVFGFNLFGSLLISVFLTIFLIQINFLGITIPGRFLFVGGLNMSLGIVFMLLSFMSSMKIK